MTVVNRQTASLMNTMRTLGQEFTHCQPNYCNILQVTDTQNKYLVTTQMLVHIYETACANKGSWSNFTHFGRQQ